jgi:hypothetical protein
LISRLRRQRSKQAEPAAPASQPARDRVAAASRAVRFEPLEKRQLLATVQVLPWAVEFDKFRGGIVDKDGQGTGFTVVQGNTAGNEYDASRLDVRKTAGVLNIRSSKGSSYGNFNAAKNVLMARFDATAAAGAFTVTTRLRGPLSYLSTDVQQAGIQFGPDQDNYVKLVAINTTANGQRLQFLAETGGSTFPLGAQGITPSIGSFSSINTLDLRLTCDPVGGTVNASYAINGGAYQNVSGTWTLTGATKTSFFRSTARAGILALHEFTDTAFTATFDRFALDRTSVSAGRPSVLALRPAAGETGVMRDAFVAADLSLPNVGGGIDPATLTSTSVRLVKVSDSSVVAGSVNTTGGGDAIVFQPSSLLQANTQYRFEITNAVKDTTGAAFVPYTATFTTGTGVNTPPANIQFSKTATIATGRSYTGVTIGPDGKLYTTSLDGYIERYDINPSTGLLSNKQVITTVRDNNGGARLITGLTFDPRSTADNLIAWVTHGESVVENAQDYTGKVSKLTGPSLGSYVDAVVNLPRGIKDHLTNQSSFGPDGGLYFNQGAMTAMGDPDNTWGLRQEHLLSAAVLRLDIARIEAQMNAAGPLDVRTYLDGGTYNPFKRTSPLRIYATGVRNAYNVFWHSNGFLYAPTNGSAAGGATPSTPAPGGDTSAYARRIDGTPYDGTAVTGTSPVNITQNDFLFKVTPNGYFGHPNPLRAEYVLNGGNPTSGVDTNQVATYAVGTQPDRNYKGAAYDFGKNYSPNGAIEYTGTAFNGALQGTIMVTRYSGGDDIIVLTPGVNGDITDTAVEIPGFTGFKDPLDLVEDKNTGNLYVAEYGGKKITLVKPAAAAGRSKLQAVEASASVSANVVYFNDPVGGDPSPNESIGITNTGSSPFTVGQIVLSGDDGDSFVVTAQPATIPAGSSRTISFAYGPGPSIQVGKIQTGVATILSTSGETLATVRLRGLATAGTGGANEPSLQKVFDVLELPINVGDPNPEDTFLDVPNTPNDEILGLQRVVKAGDGPVSIAPIAAFGVATEPAVTVGYYAPGTALDKTELFKVDKADAQSVSPTGNGAFKFDLGSQPFSIYAAFPNFVNKADSSTREVYSEDSLNTWEPKSAKRHKVRWYPLGNNVKPAPSGPEIGIRPADPLVQAGRIAFNRIKRRNSTFPNVVHDTATVSILNSGDQPLTVNSIALTNEASFQLVNAPSTPFSIPAGGSTDVQIKFVENNGSSRVIVGGLVINSSDADEPVTNIELLGHFQTASESSGGISQEPTLQAIFEVFGFNVKTAFAGQSVNTGGKVEAVGEEILAPYFQAADPDANVRVVTLATYRSQGSDARLHTTQFGQKRIDKILLDFEPLDAQSILPRKKNSSGRAIATFKTTKVFGFRIDGDEYTDPKLNTQEQTGGGYGHHWRVYQARDRDGLIIPDTYLLAQDYRAVNFDYNDAIFLVQNVRPFGFSPQPGSPAGYKRVNNGNAVIAWSAPRGGGNVTGYNLYRTYTFKGEYVKVNDQPITATEFVDFTANLKRNLYYRVTAIVDGKESLPVSTIIV